MARCPGIVPVSMINTAARPGLNATIAPGLAIGAGLLILAGLFLGLLLTSDFATSDTALFTRRTWQLVWITVVQAGLSTLLALAVGMILAWSLHHQPHFPGRRLLIALFSTAMVLPTLVVVLGLVSVLGRSGWFSQFWQMIGGDSFSGGIYGLGGILAAHIYFNAPFIGRGLLNRLDNLPAEQIRLSASLGLAGWNRFRLLEWPVMRSAIPSLAATVFLLCFTSFAIVLTLGGSPRFNTLEVAIYEAVRLDFDLGYAAKLALLQLTICGSLIWISSGAPSAAAAVRRPTAWQSRERWVGAQRLIITGLALAFVLPLTATMKDGLSSDLLEIWRQEVFLQALATSMVIATLSAGLTLALAWALAVARVSLLAPSRLGGRGGAALLAHGLAVAGALYLAVPALVLGLGLFLLFRSFGADYGLVGPAAVLLANTLMALPFALAIFLPALTNAASRYDRLAASLGLKGWARWRLLEGPMLRADLAFVAALSFCLSFGDMGVIALFGNQDFVTLPWLLYQKFGSYRTSEAAAIALVMLALTLITFVVAPKLAGGKANA